MLMLENFRSPQISNTRDIKRHNFRSAKIKASDPRQHSKRLKALRVLSLNILKACEKSAISEMRGTQNKLLNLFEVYKSWIFMQQSPTQISDADI